MRKNNKLQINEDAEEILKMLLTKEVKKLLYRKTNNTILQFFRYCFVGGVATMVDWAILFFLELAGIYYLIAAVGGFIGGLVSNFFLSKLFVFNSDETNVNPGYEFIVFAIIGVVGLLITLALMKFLTDVLSIYFMFSKIITTIIVLLWNFIARKRILYNGDNEK